MDRRGWTLKHPLQNHSGTESLWPNPAGGSGTAKRWSSSRYDHATGEGKLRNPQRIPQDQKRELLAMLSELTPWRYSSGVYKKQPLPPMLKPWQKRINAWNKRESDRASKSEKAIEKRKTLIRQEIYFGTAERALKMLHDLRRVLRPK
jgi:hypothetical protein